MPKEGVFGKVIKGGTITAGDKINVVKKPVGNL
jgi:MOSC domain-containing protein YiiM